MHFANIQGYATIKRKLCARLQEGRTPPAQLITGPVGSPALPFALALAAYLHCPQKTSTDACLVCPSCQKTGKYLHPDVAFAFPAVASTTQGSPTAAVLPAWRSFLTETPYQDLSGWAAHLGQPTKQMQINTAQVEATMAFLRTHPLESQYKTVIVWLPEHMPPPAANKLLKTLEEPPKNTFVILVSHNPTQILPTIASRTSPLRIPPYQDADLLQTLVDYYPDRPVAELQGVIPAAAGNLVVAVDLLTQEADPHFENLATWFRSLYTHQWERTLVLAEQFAKSSPHEQQAWIRAALQLMHTTLRAQQHPDTLADTSSSRHTFCHKLGHTITFAQLTEAIDHLEQMHRKLLRHAHPKLLFMATTLTLTQALRPSHGLR